MCIDLVIMGFPLFTMQADHAQAMDEMPSKIDAATRSRWEVPAFEIVRWSPPPHTHARCVIIPVINEGKRIRNLLARMATQRVADIADIIIVDGGSTDGSLDLAMLEEMKVRGLLRKTGPGKLGAQLRCAYAFALDSGYQAIVTIDGNDKDDPQAIPTFFLALDEGVDFVQASRFITGGKGENTPLLRTAAIRFVHAPMLSAFSGFRWTDTTQGFRGYSRRLLLDKRVGVFRDIFSRYELLAYLSYRAPILGYRCLEVPTTRQYPGDGPIPTKIGGLRGKIELMRTLFAACFGFYNPKV
jgi:dolichol-phosphate mannosyltransferase